MPRDNYSDYLAFIAVAREKSFTKAAALMGVSQSALSHSVRSLEKRLGIRLLTRTTRNVAPTDAGERLLESLEPKFAEIDAAIEAVTCLRGKPAGTIRISTSDIAADTILWPKLRPVLADHPDIKLEINIDYGLTNIVENRYDAGVRFGEDIEKDMIAVRIGPDVRMVVAGSPDYFKRYPKPETPHDLVREHQCINIRLPTHGGLYAWEFGEGKDEFVVRPNGQLTFNMGAQVIQAALDGFGLCFLSEDSLKPYIERGELIAVLQDWCPPFSGFHLYYPNRLDSLPAFRLIVDALRYEQ